MASPHDAIFKAVFSELENARGVFEQLLPPALTASVDWDSLVVEPGSFVDRELRWRHSDLLFSASVGPSKALLYILFEHQSSEDGMMAFRLLRYMVRAWGRHESDGTLPLIVPLVLSHADSGWNVERRFSALFSEEARRRMPSAIPDFEYVVLDVRNLGPVELRRGPLPDEVKLTLWLLRDIRDAVAFATGLSGWLEVFARLERHPRGEEKLTRLLEYVLLAGEDMRLSEIHAILNEAAPVAGAILMTTIADQLRAEGRAAGLSEGRAAGLSEGKAEALLTIFEARGLPVSDAHRRAILGCRDAEQLDRWTRQAITAASVDDALA